MKLPLMSEITPNTTPKVGAVAIFYYGSVKHVAIITSLEEDGFTVDEANYSHCLKGSRKIAWNDTRLRGFYEAGSS